MLRVIREVRPRYIVGENVYGLVTWNGGIVFDEVCTDLEAEGYAVWPIVIPAAAVNAPHRRDRIWFVAYAENSGHRRRMCKQCADRERELFQNKCEWSEMGYKVEGCCGIRIATDSNSTRISGQSIDTRTSEKIRQRRENIKEIGNIRHIRDWENFPTQSAVCSGDDGLPTKLDGITFPKWRNESIKAYGNAIVPQVAYQIFKAIDRLEKVK
jgi:DNA (cytosine-5)-methyltransferase 1